MEKAKITMVGLLFFFSIFLLPAASACEEYQCHDFDSRIYGKSVQTVVSPNGSIIAVADPDSGIISRISSEGKPVWGIRTDKNLTSIALSGDGHFISAGSFSGPVYFIDSNGNLIWEYSGLGCNNHVLMTENGLKIFVFNNGKKGSPESTTVFNLDNNGSIVWEKSIPQISDGTMDAEGKHIVLGTKGSYGNDLILVSGTGDILWSDTIPEGWNIRNVDISDDGSLIAAIKDDGIYLYSNTGKIIWKKKPAYITRSIAISPDGEYIAAGMQYKILVFNRAGTRIWDYSFDDYVYHIEISGDGETIVGVTRDMVYSFDRDGSLMWKSPVNDFIDSLSVSYDGSIIAAGSYNNELIIFDKSGNATVVNIKTVPTIPLKRFDSPSGGFSKKSGNQTYSGASTRKSPLPDGFTLVIVTILAMVLMQGKYRGLMHIGRNYKAPDF